jgi:poly(3-hydroxybutyrate) depolymerase
MRNFLLTGLLLPGIALADSTPPALDIDTDRVTVSGISSGAHMAHQLHIAYSDVFSGAGLVSGGPYNCAENSLVTAMGRCMGNTDKPLPVTALAEGIRRSAAAGEVADPANLADDRVWLFHGTLDETIAAQVHDSAAALYAEFIPTDQIKQVKDIPAGHFFPSDDSGHACNEMKEPYVGDCDYDAAGELLKFLYPGLVEPTAEIDAELLAVTLPGADDADLLETAYLYIPKACVNSDSACALHLVLHGCAQSADTIGTAFIEQSGYLEWADANDIVLAFPQVEKSVVAPLNPHACWDWWGYTGDDYAYRSGPQMSVLVDWIWSLQN